LLNRRAAIAVRRVEIRIAEAEEEELTAEKVVKASGLG